MHGTDFTLPGDVGFLNVSLFVCFNIAYIMDNTSDESCEASLLPFVI